MGYGALPAAAALACGIGGFDRFYPGKADGEERRRDHQTRQHAFEEAESGNGQEDQENDAIVRRMPSQAATDQPVLQQIEADEKDQAAHQRNGKPFQNAAGTEHNPGYKEGGDQPRQTGVRSDIRLGKEPESVW